MMDGEALRRELDIRADQQRQHTNHAINDIRTQFLIDSAARWVLIKAMLSELDEEQRARVEAKAKELAGSAGVKKEIHAMFHPEEAEKA